MTRDEVIALARDSGYIGVQFTSITTLERFAALVAAHEREDCAKVCEHYTDSGGVEYDDYTGHGYRIAAAIRSRT